MELVQVDQLVVPLPGSVASGDMLAVLEASLCSSESDPEACRLSLATAAARRALSTTAIYSLSRSLNASAEEALSSSQSLLDI